MNTVEIDTHGPIMENLNLVTVADGYDSAQVHLDHADVEAAKAEGHAALIGLVLDNGCGGDILRAALTNESPVAVDGEPVDAATLREALEPEASPAP
jgi:hypothetical protein